MTNYEKVSRSSRCVTFVPQLSRIDLCSFIQVTTEEERALGAVPLELYSHYFKSARSPILLGSAFGAVIASYAATIVQQWFIGRANFFAVCSYKNHA